MKENKQNYETTTRKDTLIKFHFLQTKQQYHYYALYIVC